MELRVVMLVGGVFVDESDEFITSGLLEQLAPYICCGKRSSYGFDRCARMLVHNVNINKEII